MRTRLMHLTDAGRQVSIQKAIKEAYATCTAVGAIVGAAEEFQSTGSKNSARLRQQFCNSSATFRHLDLQVGNKQLFLMLQCGRLWWLVSFLYFAALQYYRLYIRAKHLQIFPQDLHVMLTVLCKASTPLQKLRP